MIQPRITDLHNPSYGRGPKRPKAKKKKSHRPRNSSNPGPFALTLGLIGANPKKGVRTVAKKKSKKKATRAPAKANRKKGRKSKSNPNISAMIKRAMAGKKKKGKSRRNPVGIFGHMGAKNVLGISAGILGGVTVAKLVPPMLPASWTSTDMGRFFTTAAVAAAESFAAHMVLPAPYRDAVFAGAGAQTLSVALNPILRRVSSTITLGRLRGTGDFVRGNFPEPHNPIYQQAMLAAAMSPGAGGGSVGRYRGRFR